MNTQTLKSLAQIKGLSQADIARRAGVTRARVSQWFRDDERDVNVGSLHLKALADTLGVSADELLRPLPLADDSEATDRELTLLLWDRLYPSLPELAAAAISGHHVAIARLVQTYGLYATAAMLGSAVWREFPAYRHYILPARRRALEAVWSVHQTRP